MVAVGPRLTAMMQTSGATSARAGESAGRLCVPGPVLFWVILTLVVVVSFGSFLLCHRRDCRKWMGQSECMCPWGLGRAGCSVLAWPGSLSHPAR